MTVTALSVRESAGGRSKDSPAPVASSRKLAPVSTAPWIFKPSAKQVPPTASGQDGEPLPMTESMRGASARRPDSQTSVAQT